MALIQMGAIVTKIRGKVAGSVFSGNIAGDTLRNKSIPRRTTTRRRSNRNNMWKFFSQSWRELNATDQGDWASYATNFTFFNKLGSPVAARANLVFNNTQVYYYAINGAILPTPFLFVTPAAVVSPVVNIGIAFPDATLNFTAAVAEVYVQLYCSAPFTGNKFVQYQKKMITLGPPMRIHAGDTSLAFTAALFHTFPYLRYGHNVSFGIRRISDVSYAWSPIEIVQANIFP